MAKDKHVLFLSPEVGRALAEYTRLHGLGSTSQGAEQLLRRALLGEVGDSIGAVLLPSIREAVRLELAALDGDGRGPCAGADNTAASQPGVGARPPDAGRHTPGAPAGGPELAKAR